MIYDVTPRYTYQWLTHCKKLRVDNNWWRECLERYALPTEEQELEDEVRLGPFSHSLMVSVVSCGIIWYHMVSYTIAMTMALPLSGSIKLP